MKQTIFFLLVFATFDVSAKDDQPTSMGKGVYMLTDRSMTIFGSPDKIISKLMVKAHAFCKSRSGAEAELVDTSGTNAVPGEINSSGVLRRPAQGASGTVYFKCSGDNPQPIAPQAATNTGRFYQVKNGNTVGLQVTFPSEKSCTDTIANAKSEGVACSVTSLADAMPFRAIFEDSAMKELLVVESTTLESCQGFIKAIAGTSDIEVIKECTEK